MAISIKALTIEIADFDLGYIRPAGVFRGNSTQERRLLLDPGHLLEVFSEVRVEVGHDDMNSSSCGIGLIKQELEKGNEINFSAMTSSYDGAVSALGLRPRTD